MQQKQTPDFTVLLIGIVIILAVFISSCNDKPVILGEVSGTIVSTVKLPECPKCGYVGCIYEDIDGMNDGTDQSLYNAIIYVAKERKLNQEQIELLLTEYYL